MNDLKIPFVNMMPKHVVLCLSGGLDSVVALYYLISQGCKVHGALFGYGQRHIQELIWAKHHCHRTHTNYTTIELPQLRGSALTDGSGGVVVPNRNAIFISHAVNLAVVANAESVIIAANKDDEAGFPDCRMAFIQTYNNMLTTAEIQVEVCAPFINKSKSWIVSLGRELGVSFDETWSCYKGGVQPCGECPACQKRNAALKSPLERYAKERFK